MKKIFLMMIMAMSVIVMNAQTAVQSSTTFDNVYTGVEGGIATPLSLDNVFPLNPTATLRIGKQFTPVWGAEVEGTAWFGSHMADATHFDGVSHNGVRGSYIGVNGTVNITNLFWGYKGTPRLFEVSTVLGTGWLHTYTPNTIDKPNNGLGVKTGIDLAFNLGKTKAHTVSLRPAVLWNVTHAHTMPLTFCKKSAQLYLGIGYTYHFKTSNGTHHFKTYDIAEYEAIIASLNEELAKKPKEVIVEKIVTKEVPVTERTTVVIDNTEHVVFFAQNSDVLTTASQSILNNVTGTVKVSAFASPEGGEAYNKELSQRRANVVAEYLRNRGVTVTEAIGYGVVDNSSNRVAIVIVQ